MAAVGERVGPSPKLVTAARAVEDWPRPLVVANGVFDVLHAGHVAYLTQARALGAALLVALNSDASARRLGKGADRPLNGQQERAIVVGALEAVDFVMLFDEDDPCALIERVRPDVYVKGGDWDVERLRETALVRSWGGRALALPYVPGCSTTRLVERIRSARPA